MMSNLLHVNFRAVSQIALEGLTKDRIQGLIEDVAGLDEAQ